MKKRNTIAMLAILLLLSISISSCALNAKPIRKPSETAETSEETITSATSAKPSPTQKPTATPKPTTRPTSTSTPTPTLTPTPTIDPSQIEISFGDQNAEKAFLLADVNAKDFYGQPVELKVGQVVWIYTRESKTTDETSRFFLPEAEEIIKEYPSMTVQASNELFFDMSENRYGMTCFSGFPEYELFGTDANLRSNLKRVVEVEPWVQVKKLSVDERYYFRVDWDQDGHEDEIYMELTENRYDSVQSIRVYFRSGIDDGSFIKPISSFSYEKVWKYDHTIWPYAETILLAQKPNDEYIIIVCDEILTLLECSEPDGSLILTYDEEDVFAAYGLDGVFAYEDGMLFNSGSSYFFYGVWTTKEEVRINNDLSVELLSEKRHYLGAWGPYVVSTQDLNIQIKVNSAYVPDILPIGMVIFPEKEILNDQGKGFLYIRLADGREARISAEYERNGDERIALLDGLPDTEAFSFVIGG